MNLREFRKVGHWPTLLCAFLYFDISFMIWVLVGALANAIVADFPLSSLEKGFLVGIPILGGAVLRLVLGVMADRIGARRTGMIGMGLTTLPLLMGWLWADSYIQILIMGLLLGVAGASFAVALPLASRWYKPEQQGLAAGNRRRGQQRHLAGDAFWTVAGDSIGLARRLWFGVWCRCASCFGLFVLFAKDSPNQPPPKPLTDYVAVVRLRDTWYLCLFYAVTFGGFVGLASFLSIFFHDHYGLSPVQAGGVGHGLRGGRIVPAPVGWLCGGSHRRNLPTDDPLCDRQHHSAGSGNVASHDLGHDSFRDPHGLARARQRRRLPTGAAALSQGNRRRDRAGRGGEEAWGDFFLPTLLGGVNQMTGNYGIGFLLLSVTALSCVAALYHISKTWAGVFITKEGLAAQPSHNLRGPKRGAGG